MEPATDQEIRAALIDWHNSWKELKNCDENDDGAVKQALNRFFTARNHLRMLVETLS